jgi:hypothetical protein
MPNFGAAVRFNKVPSVGFVPESSGTAPSSPAVGQLWIDTSVTPKLLKVWDGSAWAPSNQFGGTGAGNYVVGNDARLSDTRVPTDNSVTSAKIVDGTIVDGDIASANKDGAAATPSLRTLGTGAQQAAAGNDARLSDTRNPNPLSVTDASVATNAAIAETKLALASDAAAGTASRRTLGYTGNSAMPGTARLDQIAAPTASVSMGTQRITSLAPSVAGTDAVNRNELDAARQGYAGAKEPVRVAATTNVTIATPGASIDGINMVAGDRFLATAQTTALENGIYVWNGSASPATRATDADAAGEVKDGTTVAVAEGTKQGTVYIQTASVANNAPGSTVAQVWTQFSTQATYTGTADRITVTGTTVDIASTYAGQTSITTVGTIGSGTWNGTTITIAKGGTGATDAATARGNLGAGQAGYRSLITSALVAGTPLTITHNLNTDNCIAQVRDATTGEYIGLDIIDAPATPNTLTVTSGVAFAANALDIVVIPI